MPGIHPNRRLPSVLIIDDDMVSREVMATILTMSGYLVQTASGGDESLAVLDGESFYPDVILMDTQMPGLSGTELINQLRAHTTATIYAISGSHAPDSVIRGVDGFLMKPIGPEALQRLLESHATIPRSAGASTGPHIVPDSLPPVFDPKVVAQLRDMMKESAVREIYAAVVADLSRRRAPLEEALNIGDLATVRRIGHSIKGGCSMAGALEAARIGELIEFGVDDLEYIRSLLPLLETATCNLQRMLDAEFSPQGSAPAMNPNE
ncbi:response regulator [Occallatibacter riparius]|uniref:Response regulator n=1 Tax=Occallatibacter riparius TaxID=1002689 RepID=A0A9J7BMV2_9BACT|nr:response regulator [Occallatibacter riparius]UWZ83967.1 response regulator [Occallatibacter riparius]